MASGLRASRRADAHVFDLTSGRTLTVGVRDLPSGSLIFANIALNISDARFVSPDRAAAGVMLVIVAELLPCLVQVLAIAS